MLGKQSRKILSNLAGQAKYKQNKKVIVDGPT